MGNGKLAGGFMGEKRGGVEGSGSSSKLESANMKEGDSKLNSYPSKNRTVGAGIKFVGRRRKRGLAEKGCSQNNAQSGKSPVGVEARSQGETRKRGSKSSKKTNTSSASSQTRVSRWPREKKGICENET